MLERPHMPMSTFWPVVQRDNAIAIDIIATKPRPATIRTPGFVRASLHFRPEIGRDIIGTMETKTEPRTVGLSMLGHAPFGLRKSLLAMRADKDNEGLFSDHAATQ
jgi:hypothetical protein